MRIERKNVVLFHDQYDSYKVFESSISDLRTVLFPPPLSFHPFFLQSIIPLVSRDVLRDAFKKQKRSVGCFVFKSTDGVANSIIVS